jgi:hypothetical protein
MRGKRHPVVTRRLHDHELDRLGPVGHWPVMFDFGVGTVPVGQPYLLNRVDLDFFEEA